MKWFFSMKTIRAGWAILWRFRLMAAAAPIALGVLVLWSLIRPRSSEWALLALVPFIVAIAIDLALVVVLDKPASKDVSGKPYRFGIDYMVGWQGFWRLCVLLLVVSTATILVVLLGAAIARRMTPTPTAHGAR